jgi:hypothetical protein
MRPYGRMDWSLAANLVMALAAVYGVVSWRFGRRVENEHDAALSALKASLNVATQLDELLRVLAEHPLGPAGSQAAHVNREQVRRETLAALSLARVALRDALVEVRALWGRDGSRAVLRFDTFANLFSRVVADGLGAGQGSRQWTHGPIPDLWHEAVGGAPEACAAVSNQITALVDDVERWAEPIIRRRGWWQAPQGPEEHAALPTGREAVAEIVSHLEKRLPPGES